MATTNDAGETMYRFLECRAAQYMTANVIAVTPGMTMHELEALFAEHDFNSFPVAEGGKVVGIVTKFDFLRNFAFTTGQMLPRYTELMDRKVADVMTEAVVHVEPAASLTRVLQLMVHLRARSLPVIDAGGKLMGMISRVDIMRALTDATQGDAAR